MTLTSCQSEDQIELDDIQNINSVFLSQSASVDLPFNKNMIVENGDTFDLYSLRYSIEGSLENIPVKWSLVGSIGTLNVQSGGNYATFTAASLGEGKIIIEEGEFKQTLFLTIKTPADSAPVGASITVNDAYRGIKEEVTLSYTDINSDLASSCNLVNLSNLSIVDSCTCDSAGICKVGIISTNVGSSQFDFTVTANGKTSNLSRANITINSLGASNDDEWVRIPSNSGGMGLEEFFVMKYEVKAWNDLNSNGDIDSSEVDTTGSSVDVASHLPVSIPDNQPWRNINANDAATKCESLGANYFLISNQEWMAIARNIEIQSENWTGASVGDGCLFTGNGSNSTCGYNSATDPDSGSNRNSRAKHLLSTGSYIYDFSGNAVEWTDWDETVIGFQKTPRNCHINWTNLSAVSCSDFVDSDYNSLNGSYDHNQGVGQMVLRSGPSNGALARGGSYTSGANDIGLYSFNNYPNSTYSDSDIGFRCVYRP